MCLQTVDRAYSEEYKVILGRIHTLLMATYLRTILQRGKAPGNYECYNCFTHCPPSSLDGPTTALTTAGRDVDNDTRSFRQRFQLTGGTFAN